MAFNFDLIAALERVAKQGTGRPADTLEKIVCLRNSRTAVTVLKKIYVNEAKHVAHDEKSHGLKTTGGRRGRG